MPVEHKTIDNRRQVRISGALGIWDAAATWKNLYALLCAPEPIEIDLSAVESCDGAGIQIFCQLHKMLAERPGNGHITGISDELRAAMRLAGFKADGLPIGRGEA